MRRILITGSLLLASSVLAQPATPAKADASYVLKIDSPPAKKGQKAVAKIKITPGSGYHVNKEFPTTVALNAPAGITLEKSKLTAKDATKLEEQAAEFDIAYTAAQPGKKTVTGEIKFAVCSPTSCDPKKSPLSFDVDVK
jgi:hypothetical protein